MNRFEILRATDAIVAASAAWLFVAQAWVGEPLGVDSPAGLVVPDGLPVDPEYVAFLKQVNGLSVRTYNRKKMRREAYVQHFDVVDVSHVVVATEEFRSYTDSMLDGAGTSLRSYPDERDRKVLNESAVVVESFSPALLWSTGGAESGVYVVDYEYALEPNFLTKVAKSFDEHLERSLRAMLENEGLSTYW